MRTRRGPETAEQRAERAEREARRRSERIAAEETELDAAVRQSIRLYGP